MRNVLDLGELQVEITRKDIKHVHLSVMPPAGLVRVAAPARVPLETVRLFVIDKLEWIRAQQRKLRSQSREPLPAYLGKESHLVWGRRRLLKLSWADAAPQVNLQPRTLVLQVRPGTPAQRRHEVLEAWYRGQIRNALPDLLAKWQPALGVQARHVFVQRMKTKWGSCNPQAGTIRLNTDLARKPPECLEYVLVHELVHLLEPPHGPRFIALMDQVLPQWPQLRQRLNRLPLRHENWGS